MQPGEVRVQFGRMAGTGTERFEHAVTQLEPAVEDRQVSCIGRQDLAVDPDVGGSSVG
jgi:hypothetical protein